MSSNGSTKCAPFRNFYTPPEGKLLEILRGGGFEIQSFDRKNKNEDKQEFPLGWRLKQKNFPWGEVWIILEL